LLISRSCERAKKRNDTKEYAVDSFPIEVCHNIRINRCKIYKEEEYRGYCASKREFFYGIRVHMIVTITGEPIEYVFAPGSHHDNNAFKRLDFHLLEDSVMYGDAAYVDQEQEFELKEDLNLQFFVAKKQNSKAPHPGHVTYLINHFRKCVEASFSSVVRLFPREIHAITSRGFELKVLTFILPFGFSRL